MEEGEVLPDADPRYQPLPASPVSKTPGSAFVSGAPRDEKMELVP
jgi:hypothetical protein